MNACSRYPCGWFGSGCSMQNCPQNHFPAPFIPVPQQPQFFPVNVPVSIIGITVVTMDRDGNVTIKVNQPPQSATDVSRSGDSK